MKKALRSLFRTVLVLGILGGVGAGGYYAWAKFGVGTVAAADSIPTVSAREGTFRRTVSSIGELKAARSSIITSPFNGRVTRLVPEGTIVQKDDPIIWLDTDELSDRLISEEAQFLLAQKDLEAAEEDYRLQELQNEYNLQSELARVELAEQRLEDAEQRFESERVLVERRISPQNRLEEARLSLLQSTVELRNARINLRKTEENLASNLRVKQSGIDRANLELERIQRRIDDLNDRIERSTLRSPENGEVAYMRVWKNGQMAKIAEGDSVFPRLTLMEIPDRSEMLAVIPVNELDIAAIEVGQPAVVTLDALPGRTFTASVIRKSIVPIDQATSRRPSAGTGSGGPREFEVELRLEQNDPQFFQGMTSTVEIRILELPNQLLVPLEALTLGPSGELGVYRGDSVVPTFVPLTVKDSNALVALVEGNVSDGMALFTRNPTVTLDEARELSLAALRRIGRGGPPDHFGESEDQEVAQAPAMSAVGGATPGMTRPSGEGAGSRQRP